MTNETTSTLKFSDSTLETIVKASYQEFSQSTIDIMECIINEHGHSIDEESPDEVIEALDEIEAHNGQDFTLDFDGNEYRLIPDSEIESTYRDTIEELIDDCYPEVKKAMEHSWIAIEIDWDQTVKNAMQDGYGHTFSSYDGSEHEAGDYWIFRAN